MKRKIFILLIITLLFSSITYSNVITVKEAIEELDAVTEVLLVLKDDESFGEIYIEESLKSLRTLEKAVLESDNGTTREVIRAIEDSEELYKYMPESVGKANALKVYQEVKDNLGIISVEERMANVNLTDINDHWGGNTIKKLVAKGAISGYPDGTFKPDNTISRAEFLAIVMRSTYEHSKNEKGSENHWASGILKGAYDTGVVYPSEIADTDDALNKPITRYEMARIMVRANTELQEEGNVTSYNVDKAITDYSELPSDYKPYVEQSYMKGFIGGYPDGSFGGSKTGTRAEASTMVLRMLDKGERVDVDIQDDREVVDNLMNNRGQMNEEESRKQIIKAAKNVRVYEENGKIFVKLELHELPKHPNPTDSRGWGFWWIPTVSVMDNNATYKFSTTSTENMMTSGIAIIELEGITKADLDPDNGYLQIDLNFSTAENSSTSVMGHLYSGARSILELNDTNRNEVRERIKIDSTKIWEGLE